MTSISFTCAQCGAALKVDQTKAGKSGRCPRCGASIRAPEASSESPPCDEAGPPSEPEKKTLSSEQRTRRLARASLILGILGLFPIFGVFGAVSAFVLALLALGRIKAQSLQQAGYGMALAGLLLSVTSIVEHTAVIFSFLEIESLSDLWGMAMALSVLVLPVTLTLWIVAFCLHRRSRERGDMSLSLFERGARGLLLSSAAPILLFFVVIFLVLGLGFLVVGSMIGFVLGGGWTAGTAVVNFPGFHKVGTFLLLKGIYGTALERAGRSVHQVAQLLVAAARCRNKRPAAPPSRESCKARLAHTPTGRRVIPLAGRRRPACSSALPNSRIASLPNCPFIILAKPRPAHTPTEGKASLQGRPF